MFQIFIQQSARGDKRSKKKEFEFFQQQVRRNERFQRMKNSAVDVEFEEL